jgi:hypothetical protein
MLTGYQRQLTYRRTRRLVLRVRAERQEWQPLADGVRPQDVRAGGWADLHRRGGADRRTRLDSRRAGARRRVRASRVRPPPGDDGGRAGEDRADGLRRDRAARGGATTQPRPGRSAGSKGNWRASPIRMRWRSPPTPSGWRGARGPARRATNCWPWRGSPTTASPGATTRSRARSPRRRPRRGGPPRPLAPGRSRAERGDRDDGLRRAGALGRGG